MWRDTPGTPTSRIGMTVRRPSLRLEIEATWTVVYPLPGERIQLGRAIGGGQSLATRESGLSRCRSAYGGFNDR
jgi:hypothetical protein